MTVKLEEILSLFHDDFVLLQIPQLYDFAAYRAYRPQQPAKLRRRPNPAALVGFAGLCFVSFQNKTTVSQKWRPSNQKILEAQLPSFGTLLKPLLHWNM